MLGVITYSTVPPAALVKVWLIVVPLPASWPDTVPVTAPMVHEKVVPLTPFGLVMTILVVPPLQMLWELANTSGTGYTRTVTVWFTGTTGQTGVVLGVVTVNVYTTSIGAFVPFVNTSARVAPSVKVVVPGIIVPLLPAPL
jgi:hypothetical protein